MSTESNSSDNNSLISNFSYTLNTDSSSASSASTSAIPLLQETLIPTQQDTTTTTDENLPTRDFNPTMTTLIIAGVKYEKNATKKVVSKTLEQVLHKKQDREKLPPEDRTTLFEKATK